MYDFPIYLGKLQKNPAKESKEREKKKKLLSVEE